MQTELNNLQPGAALPHGIVDCSKSRSRSRYGDRLKRGMDILLTVLFVPVILPFCFLVGLIIKIDSRGPILVKVKRLGKGYTSFYKYKFRTMVPDAEQVLTQLVESDPEVRREYFATYKIKNDPRITRFGRWLRKTSLDELPQFLNVLKGEMSWVGPRDILQSELAKYGECGPKFVTVKPGITGLWQVSGRSKLSYSQRVELDMFYIDNVSFFLDLTILARTVPVVLFGDGAC
jgi:lipopolysaccharide/colanic/teichoic acid biosynthesis glycosyltransferase